MNTVWRNQWQSPLLIGWYETAALCRSGKGREDAKVAGLTGKPHVPPHIGNAYTTQPHALVAVMHMHAHLVLEAEGEVRRGVQGADVVRHVQLRGLQ